MIRTVWRSHAATVVLTIQDLLGYGSDTRLNFPGRAENNWRYRVTREQIETIDKNRFRRLNELYFRINGWQVCKNHWLIISIFHGARSCLWINKFYCESMRLLHLYTDMFNATPPCFFCIQNKKTQIIVKNLLTQKTSALFFLGFARYPPFIFFILFFI